MYRKITRGRTGQPSVRTTVRMSAVGSLGTCHREAHRGGPGVSVAIPVTKIESGGMHENNNGAQTNKTDVAKTELE